MPAHSLIPGWEERARQIQEAGIYGPRQYLSRVYKPILRDLGLTKADLG